MAEPYIKLTKADGTYEQWTRDGGYVIHDGVTRNAHKSGFYTPAPVSEPLRPLGAGAIRF
jgi:hypothetical protein